MVQTGHAHVPAHASSSLSKYDYLYAFILTTLAGLATGIGGWLAVKLVQSSNASQRYSGFYGIEGLTWWSKSIQRILAFMFDVDFDTWIERLAHGESPVLLQHRPRSASLSHHGHSHGLPQVETSSPYAYLVLGACQAAAGGIMVAVSLLDLIPVAIRDIGYQGLLIWGVIGTVAFIVMIALIPEPNLSQFVQDSMDDEPDLVSSCASDAETLTAEARSRLLRAASGKQADLYEDEEEYESSAESLSQTEQRASGICAALSGGGSKTVSPPLASQNPTSRDPDEIPDKQAWSRGSVRSSYGANGVVAVDVDMQVVSESHAHPHTTKAERLRMFYSGIVIAVGLALHNLPEGMAVCMMTIRDFTIGLPLAAAIALHNIPEGLAISLPVYHATQDSYRAVGLALLSGLAEPLGVLVVFVFFRSSISLVVIARMLAGVAGAMLYLSFKELLPVGVEYIGTRSTIKFALLGGMVMALFMLVLPDA